MLHDICTDTVLSYKRSIIKENQTLFRYITVLLGETANPLCHQ